jgi:hypothetical protein
VLAVITAEAIAEKDALLCVDAVDQESPIVSVELAVSFVLSEPTDREKEDVPLCETIDPFSVNSEEGDSPDV